MHHVHQSMAAEAMRRRDGGAGGRVLWRSGYPDDYPEARLLSFPHDLPAHDRWSVRAKHRGGCLVGGMQGRGGGRLTFVADAAETFERPQMATAMPGPTSGVDFAFAFLLSWPPVDKLKVNSNQTA